MIKNCKVRSTSLKICLRITLIRLSRILGYIMQLELIRRKKKNIFANILFSSKLKIFLYKNTS